MMFRSKGSFILTDTKLIDESFSFYNGPLVKTTYEKNIVNKVHCLIPEEAA